jgi:hypothetical protein
MIAMARYLAISPDYTYLLVHWGTAALAERYAPTAPEGAPNRPEQ